MADLTKVPTHAAAIHKAGGPKFPEWCDLPSGYVYDEGSTRCANRTLKPNTVSDAYCPPACEAVVIAYAGEVRAWWSMGKGGSHMHMQPAYQGRWESWRGGSGESVMHESQLAASVALIEAVAGEVEG